jgi:hypothetical protein
MPFGLRVRNASNEIQIDEACKTLRLREGGTLNIVNNTGLTGYATLVDPPTPADAPLFGVHCTTAPAAAHTPIIDVDDLDDIDTG